jgi:hypothetical protein
LFGQFGVVAITSVTTIHTPAQPSLDGLVCDIATTDGE